MTNSCYIIPTDDLYLLGVLNSSILWDYCTHRITTLGDAADGGRLRFFTQFVEKLPIPVADDASKSGMRTLVQKCLDAKGVGCEAWEKEIDERVAALYGL